MKCRYKYSINIHGIYIITPEAITSIILVMCHILICLGAR